MPIETPDGKALAYFLIDYGHDHDLMWVCGLHDSRECRTYDNPKIRFAINETISRTGGIKPMRKK